MKTSMWNDPSDRSSAASVFPSVAIGGMAETTVRCRLCGETILVETNFCHTTTACPHCGLRFGFDPRKEQEPLPVPGLRLHCPTTGAPQYHLAAAPTQPDAIAASEAPQTQTPAQGEATVSEAMTKRPSEVGILRRPLATVAALFRRCWPGRIQRTTGTEGFRCR